MKQPWFYILVSLASSDRYGSDIQEDVRELSSGKVRLWPATLYGSLEELQELGWIRELDQNEEPADRTGRERFYRICQPGRKALQQEVDHLTDLASLAQRRLGQGRVQA